MAVEPRSNSELPEPRTVRRARALLRRAHRVAARTLFQGGVNRAIGDMPTSLRSAAHWLAYRSPTDEELSIADRIERIRSEVAGLDTTMRSYGSPIPGSFDVDADGKGVPGPLVESDAGAHAKTGADLEKGILLRRLAVDSKAARILELGTNTGMSATYLVSSPHCGLLVTVEGSPDLAEIGRRSIGRLSDRFEVRCELFDDALDDLAEDEPFDLAFLDGQHEGEALIHYTRRLAHLIASGGIVVLDDVYWSRDMNAAWRRLVDRGPFTLTVDFGIVGVGVIAPDGPRGHVDFAKLIGRPPIPRRVGD